MKKTILFLILLSLSAFSYADTWQATESCSVHLKESFSVEANYQVAVNNGAIYLKKQGKGNVTLYPLWSVENYYRSSYRGIFHEQDLEPGQKYVVRIEYDNVTKHGHTYTADLAYLLYKEGLLIKEVAAKGQSFSQVSDSADVLFEIGNGLSDLDCEPGARPTPPIPPASSFAVPDHVCQLFPEPVQGWQQEESKLIVTNSTVRALGWSDEYLADNRNYYTYKQNWDSGSEWPNLRVGFDKGEQASHLYQYGTPQICNGMGCFPGDGLGGKDEQAGHDGLVEVRKVLKPTALNVKFSASTKLTIRMQPEDSNYYGKVCSPSSDLCGYQQSGNDVTIYLKRDVRRLDINGYNTDKTVELKIDGERKIKNLVYESGDHLSLYLADDAVLTVKRFKNKGARPKLIFGSDVTWNVVGTDQAPGSYTGNDADFKLEDAYFDYRTTQNDLVLPVIYGPQASVHFKTAASQQFKGFILAESLVLDTSEQIYGAVTSRWLDMRGSTQVVKPDYPQPCWTPPQPKQCKPLPPENFDNGSLANWSVMGFESSTQPQTNNGRFRLNESIRRQATASAYNYVFPSAQNYLQVEFDHYAFGGDGADGIALVLSDANVPPKTGAFGGPLGYGIKLKKNHSEEVTKDIEGFAGGWLGIGLDEYGNFYRTGGEVVNKYSPRKQNLIGIRGPGSTDSNGQWLKGYKYIKGYEHKQDGQPAEDIDNRSSTPHRYRVVLNSREAGKYYLSVERRIGAGEWNTLIEKFDVLQQGSFNAVPENFRLSVTASTGWSTNTHEIDNFQVCADEAIPLTEGIHHFEFDYSGSGSTCQASEVELRACMNQDCSKRYPRDAYNDGTLKPLNVTLTPSAGNSIANWVGGTQVTVENQKELALQASESGTVTMGVASSSVPQFGFEGARCRINNGPLSAENCDVTFVKNVLAVNVADVVANRQSQGEDHLSFCSAQADAEGESRNVRMSMAYEVAPVDKTQPVSIWYKQKAGNKALEWSEEAVISPEGTVLNDVYFDSQGKAYFKIKYPEAGKVKLNASVDGVGDSAGFASFVSFPEYLKLTATKADKKGTCTNVVSGCSNSFVAAGELFDLTVTAYQAADGNTEKVAKNYQEPAITIANSVKYPAEGASATLLNTSLPEESKWANGKVVLPQSVSEVGAFEFSVAAPVASDENGKPLATSSYLGSSAFKIKDAVATIGRFYPAYFNVTETNWDYPDNQGESAYMGQAFDSVSFAVTAYNASGGATQNYGLFASGLKADFYLSGEHSDRLNIANADLGDKNWSGAVWRKQWDNSVQWSKPILPDGPFNSKVVADKSTSTSIGLSLSNSGGKTSSYVDPTLFRFKSSVNGNERLTTNVAQALLAQPDVRFGRIALDDVGGNQGAILHIPLRIEYWNDSRFIVNQDDSQTKVMGVMEKDSLSHIWPKDNSAKDVILGDGGTVSSGSSRSITATQAEPYRQQTRVWLDLDDSKNGLPWLKYNWDNKKAGEENPSTVVTFGIHRGNDRVIYRGEPGLTGQ
ncbi:TPA: DUF6701 domain-containing protein [Vibrio diabolicus]